MLPKCEAAEQVQCAGAVARHVLVEVAYGRAGANEDVRVTNAFAVMWGAEDLFAALGVLQTATDGTYRE